MSCVFAILQLFSVMWEDGLSIPPWLTTQSSRFNLPPDVLTNNDAHFSWQIFPKNHLLHILGIRSVGLTYLFKKYQWGSCLYQLSYFRPRQCIFLDFYFHVCFGFSRHFVSVTRIWALLVSVTDLELKTHKEQIWKMHSQILNFSSIPWLIFFDGKIT